MTPKANDTFLGEPGAVLDGSSVIGDWRQSGSVWSTGGITAHGQVQGDCSSTTPNCAYPEDAFLDGSLLRRVGSQSEVASGTYWIDYQTQRMWLGSNPSGHLVELASLSSAFSGTAPSVTIDDVTVRKYASPAQRGAIDASQATGWSLAGVIADQNHGVGIVMGTHGTLRNCQADMNGEDGLGATGANVVIDGCEIAGNNTAGYDPAWSAGGAKFALSQDLLVTHCYVHDNQGPGLWTDVDNERTTYSSNLVENNDGEGIFEEISYGVRITGNTVINNGRSYSAWVWGAGIQIASSGQAEVDHNYLADNPHSIIGSQQNRGSGIDGPHLLTNLWVHDNVVVSGGQVGVADDTGDAAVYLSRDNRFDRNTYTAGQTFGWSNQGGLDLKQWNSFGQDIDPA